MPLLEVEPPLKKRRHTINNGGAISPREAGPQELLEEAVQHVPDEEISESQSVKCQKDTMEKGDGDETDKENRSQTNGKRRSGDERFSIDALIPFDSPQSAQMYRTRFHCWKLLTKSLERKLRLPECVKETDLQDARDVALQIEAEIFRKYSAAQKTAAYKNRVVSRLNGLRNPVVHFKVLIGMIKPSEFSQMSPNDFMSVKESKERQAAFYKSIQEYLSQEAYERSLTCSRCHSSKNVSRAAKRDRDGNCFHHLCEDCGQKPTVIQTI